MRIFIKKILFLVSLMLVLAGCATAESPVQDAGVEELNPGDKTVIQAPARQQDSKAGITEKNI